VLFLRMYKIIIAERIDKTTGPQDIGTARRGTARKGTVRKGTEGKGWIIK